MKRKRLLISVLTIIVLIGAVTYLWRGDTGTQQDTSINAGTINIETGSLEDVVTAQGILEPRDYVDVGAQVSGQVKKMFVDIGATVKTGDAIAEIDPKPYETRIAGDIAQLKTLAAQKAEQEALTKLARQQYERNKVLVLDNAISRDTLEQTESAFAAAQAKVKSLAAQIEQARSTLEGNKTSLGYTKIFAPMDGTVVDSAIKEGQTINASQTAPVIARIANLAVMTVRAQVAEADVTRIKTSMASYFTTLGASSRKWQGTIRQILPTPVTLNDVVLYNVLIDVDNADGQLMTGMTTQNFFVVGAVKNVPLIPVSALGKRDITKDNSKGEAYEVNVLKDGKVISSIIHIGMMDRTMAEIREGLNAGDQVMVSTATKDIKRKDQGNTRPAMGPRL